MSGVTSPSPGGELLGALAEAFLAAVRRGEAPDVEQYAASHPELAESIRDLFPAMLAMERLGVEAGAAAPPGASGRPAVLGDYRILRLIGEGGMGVVYEAVRTSLLSHVALKVMHPRFRNDPTYLRRFHNEARAAAQLHHTNIVSVFDFGEHEGVCYYAMQFIRGQGLDRVLADLRRLRQPGEPWTPDPWGDAALIRTVSQGLMTGQFVEGGGPRLDSTQPFTFDSIAGDGEAGSAGTEVQEPAESPAALPPEPSVDLSNSLVDQPEARYYREVARLGMQIAQALDYAHKRGVVHRDIKPSNLLIDARGNAWITDFGLAKSEEAGDLSQSTEVVGTLRYMSPERLEGKSDPGCDVYSLGATLYELLTLRTAFPARQQMALIDQIRHVAPRPPRQYDRRIPRDLEAIVLRAMAKDPRDRFKSAGEMAGELQRFVEGRPVRFRRIPAAERLWRWCRRSPAVAALLGVVALLLVGISIGSTVAALRFRHLVEAEREAQIEADHREMEARAVVDFLINGILAAASPERARGRPPTVDEVLARADRAVNGRFRPQIEASIRHTLGQTYARLGQLEKARHHLSRALELRTGHLKADHLETLATKYELACVLRDLRIDWGQSARLFQEVYAGRLRRLGPEHRETLAALNSLALIDRDRRMWTEARTRFEQVLEARSRLLGAEDLDTLATMSNLATTLRFQGDRVRARQLTAAVLDARLRLLGREDPRTLDAYCNLAHLERDEGRFDEAERLYQFVLLARRGVLGGSHPDTLEPQRELAFIAAAKGHWRSAEWQYQNCLTLHPGDFDSAYHLAVIRLRRGELAKARALLRGVLPRYGRASDPTTAERLARWWTAVPIRGQQGPVALGRTVGEVNSAFPWFALACGGVELRAGHLSAARSWLEHARQAFDHPAGRAQAEALEAIALARLGERDAAGNRLAEALGEIETELAGVHARQDQPGPAWPEWILARAYAREAQLALSDPGFPGDPFVEE
jgi:serine/threonine protein kinase/tetratricopeptide (TPR) repeat protein